jgi:hypothetical protein
MHSHPTPPDPFDVDPFLDEARGAYVGPSDRDELVRALHNHYTGPVIEIVVKPDRAFTHRSGLVAYVDALGFYADEDGPGRFVFYPETGTAGERPVFNPVRKKLEYRPQSFGDLEIPAGEIDRYVGGFAIRQPNGSTVWLVFWHSFFHATESGDVAPGFGGFVAEVEEVEERDDEQSDE